MDTDDEVRYRATYFYSVLSGKQPPLNSQYVLEELQSSLVPLERALYQYVENPTEVPFDLKSDPLAPVIEERPLAPNQLCSPASSANANAPVSERGLSATVTRQDVYIEKLGAFYQFALFGPLFKSSNPVELKKSVTNVVTANRVRVWCIKHTYAEHILFQVIFKLTKFFFLLLLKKNKNFNY